MTQRGIAIVMALVAAIATTHDADRRRLVLHGYGQ